MIDLIAIVGSVGCMSGYNVTFRAALRARRRFDLAEPSEHHLYCWLVLYLVELWLTPLWIGLLVCAALVFDLGNRLAQHRHILLINLHEQGALQGSLLDQVASAGLLLSVPILAVIIALLPLVLLGGIWIKQPWSLALLPLVHALRAGLVLRFALLSLSLLLLVLALSGQAIPAIMIPILLSVAALVQWRTRLHVWQIVDHLQDGTPFRARLNQPSSLPRF